MKKIWSIVILMGCLLLCSTVGLRAQNIDSLKAELKKATNDSNKINILITIANITNPEESELISHQIIRKCDSLISKKSFHLIQLKELNRYIAWCYNNLGYINAQIKSEFQKALDYFQKGLKMAQLAEEPSIELEATNNIAFIYINQGEFKKSLFYCFKTLELNKKSIDKSTIVSTLNIIASNYDYLGDLNRAIQFLNLSKQYCELFSKRTQLAIVLNNLSEIHLRKGQFIISLEYSKQSLKILSDDKDTLYRPTLLLNLGQRYLDQGHFENALETTKEALEIFIKKKDKQGISVCYNNIGGVYDNRNNKDTALYYYNQAFKLYKEICDKSGAAVTLNNIASIYKDQGKYELAKIKYEEALDLIKNTGYQQGEILAKVGLAEIYLLEKRYNIAIKTVSPLFDITKNIKSLKLLKSEAKILYDSYYHNKDYKNALLYYEIFQNSKDSINNIETQKATIKQQTQYEYDKKKALADKEHELQLKQQEEKSAAEKAKQNIIIASVSVVLLLVGVFSVFLYNRFKVTQRQKAIIELKEKETHEQKLLIEEKHKEITDSINYAERIQRSFLATQSHLDGNLNPSLRGGTTKQSELTNEKIASHPSGVRNDESNYFIFFQPKDVVSGDFYWSSTLLNGNFALATADSTGHGVPGAIMSLLNITSLEKAIETETSPDKILNLTRTIIIERLKKDGSADGGKDGMDCSVCVYDFKNKKLFIAAAHNPVWIVRTAVISSGVEKDSDLKNGLDSARPDIEVIEIKPDKMPVGKHDRQDIPFTLHEIDLQEGDVVYTLTDGFPDQFGGEKGKKFMSKNLRELLAANAHLPMPEQKELLQKTFSDWKGSLEQIDDVTVIGIRI